MYYEYATGYYEQSELDELLSEFKEKCTKILLEDVNSQMGMIKHESEYLKKENERLMIALSQAEKSLRESEKDREKLALMKTLTDGIKNTVKDAEDKETKIYGFLNLTFKRDYIEKSCDAPLWIGAMTQFYSSKDKVLDVLRLFDIKMPDNVENFRLPIDWNEDELDIFFDTMHNHYVCNGCIYEGNLRFWSGSSLKDVKSQCGHNYSEIPWQYVLRNPLLKKKKYLTKIGKNAFNCCDHWRYFYQIDKYLDLSDDEIKTILNNIDYAKLTNNGDVADFALRNLKNIENDGFLEKIYSLFYKSYDFSYRKKILEMPYKYMLQWVCDNKNEAIGFIERNKDCFTEEQRKELLRVALGL